LNEGQGGARPGRSERQGRPSPRATGAQGEALAARWYEHKGYEVLARNWRCRHGEIDLVVRSGTCVVFCEVKTRSNDGFGAGSESVTPDKQRRIRRLAASWLAELGPASSRPWVDVRFDVVSITGGRLEVVEGAF
jgi:putative endonuclease